MTFDENLYVLCMRVNKHTVTTTMALPVLGRACIALEIKTVADGTLYRHDYLHPAVTTFDYATRTHREKPPGVVNAVGTKRAHRTVKRIRGGK